MDKGMMPIKSIEQGENYPVGKKNKYVLKKSVMVSREVQLRELEWKTKNQRAAQRHGDLF